MRGLDVLENSFFKGLKERASLLLELRNFQMFKNDLNWVELSFISIYISLSISLFVVLSLCHCCFVSLSFISFPQPSTLFQLFLYFFLFTTLLLSSMYLPLCSFVSSISNVFVHTTFRFGVVSGHTLDSYDKSGACEMEHAEKSREKYVGAT